MWVGRLRRKQGTRLVRDGADDIRHVARPLENEGQRRGAHGKRRKDVAPHVRDLFALEEAQEGLGLLALRVLAVVIGRLELKRGIFTAVRRSGVDEGCIISRT